MRYTAPAAPTDSGLQPDGPVARVRTRRFGPHLSLRRSARSSLAVLLAVAMVGLVGVALPSATDAASSTRVARCNDVPLRIRASSAATRKSTTNVSKRVTVTAVVTGGYWKQSCDGLTIHGHGWYRISAIDGRSVSSLYGRSYVYAPKGLFEASAPAAVRCDVKFAASPSKTSDQSSAIASFLRAHAGRRICFKPGAIYRTDGRIELDNWTGTIFGRGATFRRYTASTSQYEHFRIVQGHDIVIDGLNVMGPATTSDIQNRVYGGSDRQDQHAFSVESTNGFTLRNATLSNLWADGVNLRARNAGGVDSPVRRATLSNLEILTVGRNGVGMISVNGLVVRGTEIKHASLHAMDGEPNRSSDVLSNILIKGSNFRDYDAGHTPQGVGYAIALTPGYATVQPTNITIRNNRMDRPRVRVDGLNSSHPAINVRVTGNRPSVSGTAWFDHVRNLAFSNNGRMSASKSDVH